MTLEVAHRFPVRNESEVRTIAFDFGPDLEGSEVLTGTPTVTVIAEHGSEADATELVMLGTMIDGTKKMVLVPTGPADAADYLFKVECATSNLAKVLVLTAVLPVAK